MKSTLLFPVCLLAFATGCSFAARSPDMYRDDTAAALSKKNEEIRVCYDEVLKSTPGAGGKVTLKFDVETEQGKITNVQVDPANTTAPAPVVECVTKSVAGVTIAPPDARQGQATAWTYEFAAPAPAPAPAAAPMPKKS